jgi:hypothetical protein
MCVLNPKFVVLSREEVSKVCGGGIWSWLWSGKGYYPDEQECFCICVDNSNNKTHPLVNLPSEEVCVRMCETALQWKFCSCMSSAFN